MSTWFRNVRTGSFRRSVKYKAPLAGAACHLSSSAADAEDCSVILQNVNAGLLEQQFTDSSSSSSSRAGYIDHHHQRATAYSRSSPSSWRMEAAAAAAAASNKVSVPLEGEPPTNGPGVGQEVNPHLQVGSSSSSSSPKGTPTNGHISSSSGRVSGGTAVGLEGAVQCGSPGGSMAGCDRCERHPGRQQSAAPYYCFQCQTLACQVCLEENTHYGHHGLKLVRDAAETQQKDLHEKLAELALRLDGLKIRQDQMDTFEVSYAETRRQIQETSKELMTRIREHEERLLKEAADIHETTYKKMGFRKEELDQNILTLDILRRRAQNVVDNHAVVKDNPSQFLNSHKNITEKLTSFEHLFPKQDPKAPVMNFSSIRCNTSFGMIETSDQETPQRVRRKRLSIQHRSVSLPSSPQPSGGKKAVGFARAFQHTGNHIPGSPVLPSTGHSKNQVLNANDFSHLLHGTPASPVNSLPPDHVVVEPTSNASKKSVTEDRKRVKCIWKVTREGSGPGEINCPNDVAFLFDGSIVVADRDNNRIQIFDSQGNFVKFITATRFKPRRISITKDGNIAVTDAAENCVKVFDLSGQCIISWGKKWYKNIFKSPCGIAVNHLQQPVVSDMERHTVTIFSMEGKLIRHLQCDGNQDFHSPAYISTDTHGRIIVADNWQQCVKVFDDLGKFHFQFNRTGREDTCLEYPNGVCSDCQDNIYVADWGTHSVSKFTKDGVFIRHILTREDGLYHPAGIATKDNYLAVTAYCDSQSSVALYSM